MGIVIKYNPINVRESDGPFTGFLQRLQSQPLPDFTMPVATRSPNLRRACSYTLTESSQCRSHISPNLCRACSCTLSPNLRNAGSHILTRSSQFSHNRDQARIEGF